MTEYDRTELLSFKKCFIVDKHELNPIPRGVIRKIYALFFSPRYSMPVVMRLTQFYATKGKYGKIMAHMLLRFNQVINNFSYGLNPKIAAGVVFHHPGVCITSKTIIEEGVHIYNNVTFGATNGQAPYVKKNAKIASHSIVIGGITVGDGAIVAPGSVVVKDVPDKKVVAGVPAKILCDVTDENYRF